jgi:DNA polymerase
MPESLNTSITAKLTARLRFYEDLGLAPFYRDRKSTEGSPTRSATAADANSARYATASIELPAPSAAQLPATEEIILPKSSASPVAAKKALNTAPPILPAKNLPPAPPPSTPLIGITSKFSAETLLHIQQDLGECTRCKLHQTRNKIVFGDGSASAKLVFVGEGPGADEDKQGLPFVGRAGKLLTQMIEAMGLQRTDVYICNVVKCRPPENRQPERDEVAACSPFLFRQLDALRPTAIVCLGSTAAQTLLQTTRGISQFRGEWLDFRGHKMMATYHPAYLLRNPAAKSEVWKDLQKVMVALGLEVKKPKAK